MAARRNDRLLIEVDGGVSRANALQLIQAGADVLVAGNAVFSAQDPVNEISVLKSLS